MHFWRSKKVSCSFCHKSSSVDGIRIVAGPHCAICDECIRVAESCLVHDEPAKDAVRSNGPEGKYDPNVLSRLAAVEGRVNVYGPWTSSLAADDAGWCIRRIKRLEKALREAHLPQLIDRGYKENTLGFLLLPWNEAAHHNGQIDHALKEEEEKRGE